jgi:hypothetical protein
MSTRPRPAPKQVEAYLQRACGLSHFGSRIRRVGVDHQELIHQLRVRYERLDQRPTTPATVCSSFLYGITTLIRISARRLPASSSFSGQSSQLDVRLRYQASRRDPFSSLSQSHDPGHYSYRL